MFLMNEHNKAIRGQQSKESFNKLINNFIAVKQKTPSEFMHNSLSQQKQHSFRKSKGLQVVSNTKPLVHDRSISSPSIKQSDPQHRHHKFQPQDNLLTQEPQTIHCNYSFILDYHNARYHGKIQSNVSKGTKLVKNGPGILIDDEINFIFSHWKNNLPDGKTVLIDRLGNYFYCKLKSPLGNPVGIAIMRVGTVLLLTQFSQKTGVWNMTERDKENIMIAIDEMALSLVVLRGKIEEVLGQFKCLKSSPLSVVQFANFGSSFSTQPAKKQTNEYKSGTSHRSKTAQITQKPLIQEILLTYAQKYGLQMENCEVSISQFMESIAHSIKKECLNSKQFSYEVTRNLLNQVFSHQNNDKQPNKQNYQSYEQQKQKIYHQNFLVFTQCNSHSSKIKQTSFYFGFLNGLGIKFKNQLTDQNKINGFQKLKSFRPKSIGIHNEQMKVEDIGARFYDNNCVEEGNFKTKNTCTYENALFRPTNKLISIYNKYHKQQTTFLNEYFDKNQIQIHKLMTSFSNFVNEHIVYILNQCLIETTKFNEKSEKDQLVEKIMLKNYQKSKPVAQSLIQQSKLKGPSNEFRVQRKAKDNKFLEDDKNQALNQLKEKKSELKQKIKKVKYQIQYLPSNDNVVVMNDDKFISKIKKHLTTHRNQMDEDKTKVSKYQRKSKSDRSRSKSVIVQRSKSRKTYIQKDKPKVASPTKNLKNSPTKRKVSNTFNKVENKSDKTHELGKSQNRPQTEAELILDRINQSIEFRQKFNYGIEFNVENGYTSKKSRKRNQSPSKNRYNGRSRFFTDNELDSAVDHHLSSSSQVSVKTITPGKKNKKKEQYRHMIYSNTKRNTNNEEEKYEQQKQTEEAIRAQILGLSLQQYRKRIEYQKQQQAFMEQNFLKLIEQEESILKNSLRRISQELHEFPDPNETFGNYANESIKFSPSKIHKTSGQNQPKKMSFLQSQDKNQTPQIKNSILEDTFYCPKLKQQSLIEKRLKILQDYKELNGRHTEKQDSGYVPLYNNNLKSKNTQSPSFREYSPLDFRKQKHYENLPIYKERASGKILSPLKSMIQNRENNEIVQSGRLSYIALESSQGEKRYDKGRQIRENIQDLYKKSRSKVENQESFSGHGTAKSLTRKYQYYFD